MPTRKRRIKHAPIVDAFAERIKELRAAKGMTQKQLADKAKVTLSYVSKLESAGAAPGLDLMQRLADAFGLDVTELLPRPVPLELEAQRQAVRQRFDDVIAKSGQGTIAALESLLIRIADSPALRQ